MSRMITWWKTSIAVVGSVVRGMLFHVFPLTALTLGSYFDLGDCICLGPAVDGCWPHYFHRPVQYCSIITEVCNEMPHSTANM